MARLILSVKHYAFHVSSQLIPKKPNIVDTTIILNLPIKIEI